MKAGSYKYYILLFLLIQSCEEIDYREIFTGSYFFRVDYGGSPQEYYNDTTFYYNGTIRKSTEEENKIIVDWGTDTLALINGYAYTQVSALTCNRNGELSYPEYNSTGSTGFERSSYIRNDTIYFGITAGGLGAWETWTVLGVKRD